LPCASWPVTIRRVDLDSMLGFSFVLHAAGAASLDRFATAP
jgi:hypothetical protein